MIFKDVSEAKANRLLEEFITEACDVYDVDRDRPDLTGTSFLSPYLPLRASQPATNCPSPGTALQSQTKRSAGLFKRDFLEEFAYYVLYHFPNTPSEPLQEKYKDFPWKEEPDFLKRWQKGQTGYPIVDAGMRELYASSLDAQSGSDDCRFFFSEAYVAQLEFGCGLVLGYLGRCGSCEQYAWLAVEWWLRCGCGSLFSYLQSHDSGNEV